MVCVIKYYGPNQIMRLYTLPDHNNTVGYQNMFTLYDLYHCCSITPFNKWKVSKHTGIGHSGSVSVTYDKSQHWNIRGLQIITLRPPSTTIIPYANSLDPEDTPSNSVSHPDPNCLTLGQHFHQFWATLKNFENWSRQEV